MAGRARGTNRYGFRTRALPSAAAALVFAAILSALLALGVTSAFFARLRPSLPAVSRKSPAPPSAGAGQFPPRRPRGSSAAPSSSPLSFLRRAFSPVRRPTAP